MRCKDCEYYAVGYSYNYILDTAQCFRYPPRPIFDGKIRTVWPIVKKDDVCGEFKLK